MYPNFRQMPILKRKRLIHSEKKTFLCDENDQTLHQLGLCRSRCATLLTG